MIYRPSGFWMTWLLTDIKMQINTAMHISHKGDDDTFRNIIARMI